MPTAKIAIVGAGLSGLYAAYALQKRGITDYVVLEARDTLGGRIVSVPPSPGYAQQNSQNETGRLDLGPSWFWPGYQRQLEQVVQELGLYYYEQYETGDMLVERSQEMPAARMRGYANSPPSMRLVGGMGALIDALHLQLDPLQIHTGQVVRSVSRTEHGVELASISSSGLVTTWDVEQVLLAMPPRLVQASINFSPTLPPELSKSWEATATWMAPHAKYFAVFDTPFWREQGLSGAGRSGVGPLVEIHDASLPKGSAALFGFIGVPATYRKTLPELQLRALCRTQLVRMFGPQAGTPETEFIKDWAVDPFTATEADLVSGGQHAIAPSSSADSGPWQGRLIGVASEWSPQFPGYVAGAIEAVSRGVLKLL